MDVVKGIIVILVTGATGTVGRQVVTQLTERGLPVRALTRDPASAGLPADVEVVRGDLAEPASLEPHLAGADSVFLVWPFTAPGLAAGLGARVVEMLASHGTRVVYLSAQAAAGRPDSFWATMERLIEDSGAAWTFLRPTGFAANTLMWADQIRGQGVVRWPYGAATRSLIHEHDLAAVAVRALTEDRHAGQRYLLTGPEAITQADQVRIIGEVTGRAVAGRNCHLRRPGGNCSPPGAIPASWTPRSPPGPGWSASQSRSPGRSRRSPAHRLAPSDSGQPTTLAISVRPPPPRWPTVSLADIREPNRLRLQ